MAIKEIAVLAINAHDLALAEKIKTELRAAALKQNEAQKLTIAIHSTLDGGDVKISALAPHIQGLFKDGIGIVAILATGALVRILSPLLKDKLNEPPVLSISNDGASIVPILGGHHGANALARQLAQQLDCHAAITTAGDVRFNIALDQPPKNLVLKNQENAKNFMARVLNGERIRLIGNSKWLENSDLPFVDSENSETGSLEILISEKEQLPNENQLVFCPKNLVLGMGCERGTPSAEIIEQAEKTLKNAGLSSKSISFLASIDLKADEIGLHEAAKHFNVPIRFFSKDELNAQKERLQNPSDVVFSEVGTYGVAEGAALVACDELIVPKEKSNRVTCAIGFAKNDIDPQNFGRIQGHVSIVGLGPGDTRWRSNEARHLVSNATDLVGYSLYLDLLEDEAFGKIRHDFDLGKEEDRVRHALELAGQGKNVALICSGDPGIYAMATLAFELLEHGNLVENAERVSLQVSPGISALQGAAARAGAPLGHDFCTISLSDLLTPWPAIERRIKAASEGDFVIAFYNPVSKRRRTQLAHAKTVLLSHRPKDTPVILATNLGRKDEHVRFVELEHLNVDDVDMLTVVVVGSSETRKMQQKGGKQWVYTPRGYSDKATTEMIKQG